MRTPPAVLERIDPADAPVGTAPTPSRTLVVIPTYDEAATIGRTLRQVRLALPDADVLVVDDSSPDGTAHIVEALGAELGRIILLQRPGKAGLGTAYRAGFAFGLTRGYSVLVEMDADGSHDPAALPALVGAVEAGAALAIGSRYVDGATIPGWTARRRALSRSGNRYAGAVLGVDVHDLTSGFRAFRADVLAAVHAETTEATGYAFQIELAYRVARSGRTVVEVPIVFNDRLAGESKMSTRITIEALGRVTWWGARDRLREAIGRPVAA